MEQSSKTQLLLGIILISSFNNSCTSVSLVTMKIAQNKQLTDGWVDMGFWCQGFGSMVLSAIDSRPTVRQNIMADVEKWVLTS